MSNPIHVEQVDSLEALAPRREEIDALNLASRRPCPFSTFEYLETFLAHDEHEQPGDEPLFLLALEGTRLVGFLPLRRRRHRWTGVPYREIELLLGHDTDRPHVVARAEDEARCSGLFYEHLLARGRGWSAMELAMQDADSALLAVPKLSPLRFHARRFENMDNTTLPLPASFGAWFHGLEKHSRQNVARLGRRLLRAGKVEVVSSSDPRARLRMLELYLDLEKRSWKERARAGIGRVPMRTDLYRALCRPGQPMQVGFDFVLLDDLPIAALLTGSFAGVLYAVDTAYDEAQEALGPGLFLFLMTIGRAIEGGFRAVNFKNHYAYYKAKLGGVVTPTWAVQVYRTGTAPWLKARLGELKRRLRPPDEHAERFNPTRRQVQQPPDEEGSVQRAAPPPEHLARARAVLAAFQEEQLEVRRLEGAALLRELPFSLTKEAA